MPANDGIDGKIGALLRLPSFPEGAGAAPLGLSGAGALGFSSEPGAGAGAGAGAGVGAGVVEDPSGFVVPLLPLSLLGVVPAGGAAKSQGRGTYKGVDICALSTHIARIGSTCEARRYAP